MSATATATAASEDGLYALLDKFIKANNNLLPLQAYLNWIETDSHESFAAICNMSSTPASDATAVHTPLAANSGKLYNSNLLATLSLVNYTNSKKNRSMPNEQQSQLPLESSSQIMLAQKLYKIIISIDYSPLMSSLNFIQKSLEKVFEKISIEYYEFIDRCGQLEPGIYVTVLLWNLCNVSPSSKASYMGNVALNMWLKSGYGYGYGYDFDAGDDEQQRQLAPFVVICHAKRLLKSNISELAAHIYNKINELKSMLLLTRNKKSGNSSYYSVKLVHII
jgi:hypothetical protein